MSASLPVAWLWRTPMPRWSRKPTGTVESAPLWLSIATWPSARSNSINIVEKLAIAPVPKLASPCEVGPEDPHAGLVRRGHHPPLLGLASNGVDLAEARRHHHRDLDAARGAVLHSADGVVPGDRDDHHLWRFRQIREAGIALVALDLGARRIDRKNLALKAELVEVMHRAAANLIGIFRSANNGDGTRIEGSPETAHNVVLSKVGTRPPVNRRYRAVTLSPMARSLSPWALMRKPAAVSTSTMP